MIRVMVLILLLLMISIPAVGDEFDKNDPWNLLDDSILKNKAISPAPWM